MNYTYILTAATTICRSTPGKLHTITVQGGTGGTIVFSFDSTNALMSYHFDINLAKGLTIVTGAATKLTVSTGPQD